MVVSSLLLSLTHGLTLQFDAMCIVDEPVEDGIGDSGVGDGFVPGGHRELTGDDGGACAVAVVEDLQELVVLAILDLGHTPVVDEEESSLGDFLKQAREAAVCLGQGEAAEEFGCIEVDRPVALPTRLVCQGAGHKGLAASSGACDDDVLVVGDPVAGGEMLYLGTPESPAVPEVEVLDGGGLFQPGVCQPGCQGPVLLPYPLAFDQHGEAFLEAELGNSGTGPLLLVGFGHAVEFHLIELCHGRFIQHLCMPFCDFRIP